MYANDKCQTPEILLISAFKNSSDLTMLDLLIPITTLPSEFSNLKLQIEAYITRENQPISPETSNKNITALWFKPKPSDTPITPVLGQNNWLWLAAIVSSSFIIFLLLIAILNRYYIYPIDKNTNKIYSLSSKTTLNILILCISIIITSTLAFLWNKKQNAMESKQIQSLEGATPVNSPNSWFYNADRELESLPQHKISLSTNVHYGERPDLKSK